MITTALVFGITFFLALIVSWTLGAPIFFVADPILGDGSVDIRSEFASKSILERERLFLSLEELESDYRAGKIETLDYGNQKEEIVSSLAAVMRTIEDHQ